MDKTSSNVDFVDLCLVLFVCEALGGDDSKQIY